MRGQQGTQNGSTETAYAGVIRVSLRTRDARGPVGYPAIWYLSVAHCDQASGKGLCRGRAHELTLDSGPREALNPSSWCESDPQNGRDLF
jgi:hypothetical protein